MALCDCRPGALLATPGVVLGPAFPLPPDVLEHESAVLCKVPARLWWRRLHCSLPVVPRAFCVFPKVTAAEVCSTKKTLPCIDWRCGFFFFLLTGSCC